MSEMVERVARAMDSHIVISEKMGTGEVEWIVLRQNGQHREAGRSTTQSGAEAIRRELNARATIAALREPTDAMTAAADKADVLRWSLEPGEGLDGVDWEAAWQAMIDEALKP